MKKSQGVYRIGLDPVQPSMDEEGEVGRADVDENGVLAFVLIPETYVVSPEPGIDCPVPADVMMI